MPEITTYLAPSELLALAGGLAMGWFVTEAVKRFWRHLHVSTLQKTWWFLPLLGFLITAVSTWSIWPQAGLFPHPVFAALFMGVATPVLYKVIIATLRKLGLDWLAEVLTGKKGS